MLLVKGIIKRWHRVHCRKKNGHVSLFYLQTRNFKLSIHIASGPLDVSTWLSHRYLILNVFTPELLPFSSPDLFFLLGSTPWEKKRHSPVTWSRHLVVILNTPLSRTSYTQAVNRSHLNLLLPFPYCHHWSIMSPYSWMQWMFFCLCIT